MNKKQSDMSRNDTTCKDPIVDWSKEEKRILELRGISTSSYGDNHGSSTYKHESGKIETCGWTTGNADPDWGSCDRHNFTIVYKNFNDFIQNKRM